MFLFAGTVWDGAQVLRTDAVCAVTDGDGMIFHYYAALY